MSLITLNNVSKLYGNELILDHISLQINRGEKIALVGKNGEGKTTILKLILGEIKPSLMPKENNSGEIAILNNLKIAYLDQNIIKNPSLSAREELYDAYQDIFVQLNEYNSLVNRPNLTEEEIIYLNNLLTNLVNLDAFNLDKKINNFFKQFHLPLSYLNRQISTLSGGEQMKIAFIKILLNDYDVLLLDEPTNHLDIASIEWLEDYLKADDRTLLFVSHDRYFLNAVANKIFDLENKKVTTYHLSYDDYLLEKQTRYQNALKQYEKDLAKKARLEKFITYFMPKPRFASRAKDRVHKLAKLEKSMQKPVKNNEKIHLSLSDNALKNKQIIEFKDVVVGYETPLIAPFSFLMFSSDRLAIIGQNGVGKTTLIKTIFGEIRPLSGEINYKRKLSIGYIKQNNHEVIDGTLFSYLKNLYPFRFDQEIRHALGAFLFEQDDVYKNVKSLSNGERMRLYLAGLTLTNYDLLLLDEPTNHLDLITKECLLDALKKYRGAIIFISHDRYFINSLATHSLSLSKTKTILNEGSYDDLKDLISFKETKVDNILTKKESINTKSTLSHNRRKACLNKMLELENEIKNLEIEREALSDKAYARYNEINSLIKQKEDEYLEILTILDKND